jgi:hypothetical protein
LKDRSQNSIFIVATMHVTPLSLLYAATWLTSTTSALVARNPILRARADTTPEYPTGYDAKTCPFDRTSITLHASPPTPEAVTLTSAALRASTSLKTKRALSPGHLSQVCRQTAHFRFTGTDYYVPAPFSGRILTLTTTSIVQPGLYVGSIKADKRIRSLEIDDMAHVAWQHGNVASELFGEVDHMSVRFQIARPVPLKVTIRFWEADTVGEFSFFKIGPSGYNGPSPLNGR